MRPLPARSSSDAPDYRPRIAAVQLRCAKDRSVGSVKPAYQTVIEAVKASLHADARVIAVATDGDALVRVVLHELLLGHNASEFPELAELSEIPFFDSKCGPGGTVADVDYRHVVKRFMTAIRRPSGVQVGDVLIVTPIIRQHFITFFASLTTSQVDTMFFTHDKMNVPVATTTITHLARLEPIPSSSPMTSAAKQQRAALILLGSLFINYLEAYMLAELDLSERLVRLAHAAHLAALQFRAHGRRALGTELVHDIGTSARAGFSALVQHQAAGQDELMLLGMGTDRLEGLFGEARAQAGSDTSITVATAARRLAAAQDSERVFAERPNWRGKDARRDVRTTDGIDALSPRDVVKPQTVRGVSATRCFDEGLDRALESLAVAARADVGCAVPTREQLKAEGYMILSPAGQYLLLRSSSSDDDDEDAAPPPLAGRAVDELAPTATGAAPGSCAPPDDDATRPDGADEEEDALAEHWWTTQDAALGASASSALLTAEDVDEATEVSADAAGELRVDRRARSFCTLPGGELIHKAKYISLACNPQRMKLSADRLRRVAGLGRAGLAPATDEQSDPSALTRLTDDNDDPLLGISCDRPAAVALLVDGRLELLIVLPISINVGNLSLPAAPRDLLDGGGVVVRVRPLYLTHATVDDDAAVMVWPYAFFYGRTRQAAAFDVAGAMIVTLPYDEMACPPTVAIGDDDPAAETRSDDADAEESAETDVAHGSTSEIEVDEAVERTVFAFSYESLRNAFADASALATTLPRSAARFDLDPASAFPYVDDVKRPIVPSVPFTSAPELACGTCGYVLLDVKASRLHTAAHWIAHRLSQGGQPLEPQLAKLVADIAPVAPARPTADGNVRCSSSDRADAGAEAFAGVRLLQQYRRVLRHRSFRLVRQAQDHVDLPDLPRHLQPRARQALGCSAGDQPADGLSDLQRLSLVLRPSRARPPLPSDDRHLRSAGDSGRLAGHPNG